MQMIFECFEILLVNDQNYTSQNPGLTCLKNLLKSNEYFFLLFLE